jgi:hypothetical protein
MIISRRIVEVDKSSDKWDQYYDLNYNFAKNNWKKNGRFLTYIKAII